MKMSLDDAINIWASRTEHNDVQSMVIVLVWWLILPFTILIQRGWYIILKTRVILTVLLFINFDLLKIVIMYKWWISVKIQNSELRYFITHFIF